MAVGGADAEALLFAVVVVVLDVVFIDGVVVNDVVFGAAVGSDDLADAWRAAARTDFLLIHDDLDESDNIGNQIDASDSIG
jgi:hypothetical protein